MISGNRSIYQFSQLGWRVPGKLVELLHSQVKYLENLSYSDFFDELSYVGYFLDAHGRYETF